MFLTTPLDEVLGDIEVMKLANEAAKKLPKEKILSSAVEAGHKTIEAVNKKNELLKDLNNIETNALGFPVGTAPSVTPMQGPSVNTNPNWALDSLFAKPTSVLSSNLSGNIFNTTPGMAPVQSPLAVRSVNIPLLDSVVPTNTPNVQGWVDASNRTKAEMLARKDLPIHQAFPPQKEDKLKKTVNDNKSSSDSSGKRSLGSSLGRFMQAIGYGMIDKPLKGDADTFDYLGKTIGQIARLNEGSGLGMGSAPAPWHTTATSETIAREKEHAMIGKTTQENWNKWQQDFALSVSPMGKKTLKDQIIKEVNLTGIKKVGLTDAEFNQFLVNRMTLLYGKEAGIATRKALGMSSSKDELTVEDFKK